MTFQNLIDLGWHRLVLEHFSSLLQNQSRRFWNSDMWNFTRIGYFVLKKEVLSGYRYIFCTSKSNWGSFGTQKYITRTGLPFKNYIAVGCAILDLGACSDVRMIIPKRMVIDLGKNESRIVVYDVLSSTLACYYLYYEVLTSANK